MPAESASGQPGGGAGQATPETTTTEGRNQWDFHTALVAIVGLVGITLLLVYTESAHDVETILGIVVPAIAAIFGISLGYWSGNTTGKTTGQQQGVEAGKKQAKTQLEAGVDEVTDMADRLLKQLQTEAVSDRGARMLQLKGTYETPVDLAADPADLNSKIKALQAAIKAL